MKILALEFSSERRSVALAVDGRVVGCAREATPRASGPIALVQAAAAEAGIQRDAIECLAVGLGPGSYTGIRVAIALAQGWQLARGVRILGIHSTETLAEQARRLGWFGNVALAIDAQRNEYSLARYHIAADGAQSSAPHRLARLDEILRLASAGDIVISPEPIPGAANARRLDPDAAVLAELAHSRTDYRDGSELEPVYLRETGFVKAPPPRKIPGLRAPPAGLS